MSDDSLTASTTSEFSGAAKVVDPGRPIEWLKQGWAIFVKAPGLWIGVTVVTMVIGIILSLIPIIGHLIMNLAMPVLGGGLLLGCRKLQQEGNLGFDDLFAGFKQNTGNLVMVGVYYTIGMVVIVAVTFMVGGGAALGGAITGHGVGMGIAAAGFLLAMLIMLVLMVPLVMAAWFAPALVVFGHMAPVPAMKASFAATLKNILPFLVYGVVLLILGIAASLPLFLGWLVLGPVLVGAQYASYMDIFE